MNESTDRSALEAAVRTMMDRGWSRGDIEVFAELMADPVVFHYAGSPRTVALDEMGRIVARWREAFPDLILAIDDLVAEDDRVAARLTLTGTHEGPWGGVEATGNRVSMSLMMFLRFEDGRVVELWEVDDQLGLRRELGIG